MSLSHRLNSRLRFTQSLGERPGIPGPPRPGRRDPHHILPRHRSLYGLYRELYRLLAGHRATLAVALVTLSVATLVKLVPPAATKLVVDYVLLDRSLPPEVPSWLPIPSRPADRLVLLAVGVLATSAVGTVIGLVSRWQATRTAKRVQVKVRRLVFEHASRLPLHRVYQLKAGGASSLLRQEADGVGELVFSMFYNPWRALVQLCGGLVILAWVDWRFLLGSVALVPALHWTHHFWERRLRALYGGIREKRQDIDAMAAEVFSGMRVVRAFGRQRWEAARMVGESHLLARQELYAWWWSRGVEAIWDLLMPVASGALLLYGGSQVLAGRLSPGDLMMFLVYLTMLLEPLTVIATGITQFQNNLSGFDRVLDLLAEPREMADAPGHIYLPKRSVAGRIELQAVGFRYPGTEAWVLRNIDLTVEPGQVIALVGRSGAGKTTLCNLIARFYDPTEGIITLDGIDLPEIALESYRRLLGIVEQDVFLFDGTVAENIAYAARRATWAEIERAAAIANATEFIEDLPEGYDTRIGERGVKLSAGQRQRIAIARAVLADPAILILDEATSNLDTENERLIQRGLGALLRSRTSFVIAHRLSTIRHADRILVLEAGSIIEAGTHAELMTRKGRYREMVELQRLEGG